MLLELPSLGNLGGCDAAHPEREEERGEGGGAGLGVERWRVHF